MCSKALGKLAIQPTICLLFVDNQAALHGIKSPWKAKYQRIKEVHELLCSHELTFELHWVKGHSNVAGNEEANLLAIAKVGAAGCGKGLLLYCHYQNSAAILDRLPNSKFPENGLEARRRLTHSFSIPNLQLDQISGKPHLSLKS